MLSTIIVLFVIVGIGFGCKKVGLLDEEFGGALERLVMNLTLPAAIISSFVEARFGPEHFRMMAVGITSALGTMALLMVVFKPLFRDRKIYGTAIPIAYFSNAGFMGLPVIFTLFGATGMSLAIPFQVTAHSPLVLFLLGGFIFAYFGDAKKKKSIGEILKKVLLRGPIIAVVVGVFLNLTGIPEVLSQVLKIAGGANTFLIMFLVGLMLNPTGFKKKYVWPASVIVLTTLFVVPGCAYLIGTWYGLDAFSLQVATLEAAMPMALLAVVLVKEYGLDVQLAEMVLFFSTALSVLSLPIVQAVLF